MKSNYINHVVFVIDRSGSMRGLETDVERVFDNQIKNLKRQAKELGQENRVSVYVFDDSVDNLIYDKDVNTVESLNYKVRGGTALIDATLEAIGDLKTIPQKYGDHGFLVIVLTDGQENASRSSSYTLRDKISSLDDNWTVSVLVPDLSAKKDAEKFGFPIGNIAIWEVSREGIKKVDTFVSSATTQYLRGRAAGIRSTKNLFQIDASTLKTQEVKNKLTELRANRDYSFLPVRQDSPIREYVESWLKEPYVAGSAYYQLTKPETIQANKQLCVQDKLNGKVYAGFEAREMLQLPHYDVKVSPDNYGKYYIFVQSTSVNRKLLKGTNLIVLK